MSEPIFFYSEICPVCPAVLLECVDYFLARGVRLLVRKPYISERSKLPGLPALFLPADFCNAPQPYVLVGENIPEWLKTFDPSKVEKQ